MGTMGNDERKGISRRQFAVGCLATAACAARPIELVAAARPVLHVIGHSHIDAAWLWPWTDAADLAATTFRSALDRMKETPGFCYSHSSTAHYEWVQKADRAMFAEIRQRVAEGRWEAVGGWPVEPDCNIPSTESFARHCLYGKTEVEEMLNTRVRVGFNPDSFGHAAGLPTILRQAGYGYYVFMRPQEHEMKLPRLFWWEGPDGSRVLTYHIYRHYDGDADGLREASENVFAPGFSDGAYFLGVGDHGGAATREQVQRIAALRADSSLPELRWSTIGRFFEAVEKSPALRDLPVIRGDLQHHARGCYSARGQQKADNRRAEHEMFRAEAVGTAARFAYGAAYPHEVYRESWKQVTFNQFHDLLAGSALYADYTNSRDGLGLACQNALWTRHPQLMAMARQVDLGAVEGGVIFAYNTLPWTRKALLEFHYETGPRNPFGALKDQAGNRTPLQMRPSDSMTNFFPRLSAWVDLPASGYRVFSLVEAESTAAAPISSAVKISSTGFGISSFTPLQGPELLAGDTGLVVIEDKSDTWAHDIASFRTEVGRPRLVKSFPAEEGPVTRVTRQILAWKNSLITVDIAEFHDCDAIEFRFVIDWHEHEEILKFEIPARLGSPRLFAKVPGAVLERGTDGNEEPYQDWVALEGDADGAMHTLALLNAQTYSYDCLNGLLRTILIRSAPYARHNPNQVQPDSPEAWQDQGRQERTFWLVGGRGKHSALCLDRRAQELQSPAEYVFDSRHHGTEPWERSFLEVTPSHVEVLSIKAGERDDTVIVRLQERSGAATAAHLRSHVLHLDQDISLSPWQISTLSIARDGSVKPVSILER